MNQKVITVSDLPRATRGLLAAGWRYQYSFSYETFRLNLRRRVLVQANEFSSAGGAKWLTVEKFS